MHTFGGGQHDLLLRIDVLQLFGTETLQLALQIDGNLGQVLQSRGAHVEFGVLAFGGANRL